MENQVIQETFELIKKDFDIESKYEVGFEDQLLNLLTPIIHRMLNRDFERLLQICYRIDLGENLLKEILHHANPETMARELAQAIIQRQIKKIEIRKRYS
ncbi:hypothetical protein Belba_1603 [Belliella baltica DSM 15883]|uniref:Uncharacterized protein n=1 Tax=Belliella baltica (strain DSM 15883 / CIP 108006 / LMG 21964 / BA134) TaxID=866536 RepID=I3Z4P2_BELBD|nr:hypothetical protein [Belliella baltica]AFL84210.1 hypothetical protein Belba_1603 [Belliella baltica DSM 15883]